MKKKNHGDYITHIPEYLPTFQEIAEQMRINADIIKKEISDHIDSEIQRLKDECEYSLS